MPITAHPTTATRPSRLCQPINNPMSTPAASARSSPIQCASTGSANHAAIPAPSATGSQSPIRSRSASSRVSSPSASRRHIVAQRAAMGV